MTSNWKKKKIKKKITSVSKNLEALLVEFSIKDRLFMNGIWLMQLLLLSAQGLSISPRCSIYGIIFCLENILTHHHEFAILESTEAVIALIQAQFSLFK